jgi:branched-chain amino acid transport system permease protein
VLAGWTQHWMVILGPLIVVIVIVSNRGIFGVLAAVGRTGGAGRARPGGKSGEAR